MYRIIGGDGMEYGPVSAEQLRQWIQEGRATAETRVRLEGNTEWRPLSAFPELGFGFPVTMAPRFGQRRTHPLATTSLILGILALTIGICCYGLPFNLLGLIFALVAISQIRTEPHFYEGQGVALAGLILCAFSLLLMVILGFAVGLATALGEVTNKHSFQ